MSYQVSWVLDDYCYETVVNATDDMSPIEIVNYAIVEVLEEVVNDKDYAGPFAGELVKLVHYLQDTVPSVKQVSTLEE